MLLLSIRMWCHVDLYTIEWKIYILSKSLTLPRKDDHNMQVQYQLLAGSLENKSKNNHTENVILVRNTEMSGKHLNQESDFLSIDLPIRGHQCIALKEEKWYELCHFISRCLLQIEQPFKYICVCIYLHICHYISIYQHLSQNW